MQRKQVKSDYKLLSVHISLPLSANSLSEESGMDNGGETRDAVK